MAADSKRQRRPRGSAWYWKQTDCWYYTPPGTTRRVPLVDEQGKRVRGKENRTAAELALARIKAAGRWRPTPEPATEGEWSVARVCSEYLGYCDRGVGNGTVSEGHREGVVRNLNALCEYGGALPVSQLSLHSFSEEDEKAIYGATDECFRDFLTAAIQTGLRPFCELARMTADHVVETDRGMMWRVYSSKTKKTRKIPVRPEVAQLTRRLMATVPSGSGIALFRNTQGKPWKKVTGVGRFLAIKRKLGWGEVPSKKHYSCYTCRHTFAHRMLSGYWNGGVGCSIETLAELMGNTPKVAFDHYGREWGQYYQEPLWAAIGEGP